MVSGGGRHGLGVVNKTDVLPPIRHLAIAIEGDVMGEKWKE